MSWPIIAVHAHVLPTGKVLFYPYSDDPRLWDPATGTFTNATQAGYNIFCTGHAFLADGRLLVAGGHIANNVGEPKASIYDPFNNTWTRLPDMNAGRWYPTSTALANGDILVVSGDRDLTVGVNPIPQVWQTATNSWRNLINGQLGQDLYPRMHLAPNGKVFFSMASQLTRYLDTNGNGLWTTVGLRNFGDRNYGSSVMYDDGKVMVVGGGDPPTNTAEVIDLNAATPTWRYVGAMNNARRQIDATLLPDGKVLVTGGSSGAGFDNSLAPVFAAEIWDPATEQWTIMAGNTKYHGYHSNALLLPDGRVLTTGGDNQLNAEIYSPPYLFKGARPTIDSAPISVSYGQTFFVQTPNAASITKVTWIRLPSVTHAFDQNQRINRLSFLQTANGLNVTAPSSANLCPPGHYMLFILNTNGVPSEAKIIQIGGVAVPAPAAPSGLSASAISGTQIDLAWTDNSANEDGFKIERCQPSQPYMASAGGIGAAPAVTVESSATDEVVVDMVGYQSSGTPPTIAAGGSQTERWNFRSGNDATYDVGSAASTKAGAASVSMAWTLSESRNWAIGAVSVKGASGSPPTLDAVSHSENPNASTPATWNHTSTGTDRALIVGINMWGAIDYIQSVMYNGLQMLRAGTVQQGNAHVYIYYLPNPASGTHPISIAFTGGFNAYSGGAISFTDVDQQRPIRLVSGCTNFAQIAQVGAGIVSYSNTGLVTGTNYAYRVRAYNVGGVSSYSNTASANTSTTPPAAPLNLAATAISTTQIDLTWTDNSNSESGFKIERCQGSGCTNFAEIDQVAAGVVSYSNTGLMSGATYIYRVRAYNAGGDSGYSNTSSATTGVATPAAPTNLLASAISSTRIDLGWTDNSNNEDGFKIESCQGAGCTNFTQIDQVGAEVISYSNTGLTSGTSYTYRVRAFNTRGDSGYSNTSSATTTVAAPAAPNNLLASAISSTRIDLTWTDNSNNETGFKIESCQGGGCTNFTQIDQVGAGVISYSNTGLTSNTSYTYRVRATNAGGDSGYSNTASATTGVAAPAAPTNLLASAISSTRIDLAWTDSSNNESDFKIESCQGSGCTNFTQIDQVAAGVVSYSNTGLTAGTNYSYRVRAFNAGGDSGYSNTISATTPVTPPAAPLNLLATAISGTRIDLTWTDNSNNESGFKIERCQGAGCTNFVQIIQVGAGVVSYSNTGLSSNTTYTYRVRATNSGGDSAYSNTSSATTPDGAPAAPLNLVSTTTSATSIVLTWTDNSNNEDGFNIEISTDGRTFTQITTVGPNVTTYSSTGLNCATFYYYRILAFNAIGNSAYSSTVKRKTSQCR